MGKLGSVSRGERRITPRELEVLALVANGFSTAEIARELWITEDTVQTHFAYYEGLWRGLKPRSSVNGNRGGDV